METAMSTQELTEYEKQRLENVRRNQAMLAALGVEHAATDLRSTGNSIVRPKSELKGYQRSADKRRREEPIVIRRSLRARGLSPDREVQSLVTESEDLEDSPKKSGKHATMKGFTSMTVDHHVVLDHSYISKKLPITFKSVYLPPRRQGVTAACLFDRLQILADEAPLSDLRVMASGNVPGNLKSGFEPSSLALREEDVARVVPDRIFCVSFLPLRHRLVVLAGGKGGHLGLWDVDCDKSEGDGVHIYQPHGSPVTGISIAPCSAIKPVTCSYDGTVRLMDFENSKFDLLYSTDDILSAICFLPNNAHSAFVAEADGCLKMLDTREGNHNSDYQLHSSRINTIEFNPQRTYLMASSSSDGTACLWDIRNLRNESSSLLKVHHSRAVHSAHFSPSGNSLATCSYDDTIGLLNGILRDGSGRSGFKQEKPIKIDHPNRTNRWISPFRAIWGWDDRYLFVGNMKKIIDVISTDSSSKSCFLSSPFMTSIPCRLASHPLQEGTLVGSTAGGQVYVWRK